MIKRVGECDHCHNYIGDLVPIIDFSSGFMDVVDSCCQDCYARHTQKESNKDDGC